MNTRIATVTPCIQLRDADGFHVCLDYEQAREVASRRTGDFLGIRVTRFSNIFTVFTERRPYARGVTLNIQDLEALRELVEKQESPK